ncbi:MAG: hypothetical protein K0R58_4315 [Ramlibacter sp.]|jgi:hypothetical protein|nr:hypothetical protein [Ramlibacter sp.]
MLPKHRQAHLNKLKLPPYHLSPRLAKKLSVMALSRAGGAESASSSAAAAKCPRNGLNFN